MGNKLAYLLYSIIVLICLVVVARNFQNPSTSTLIAEVTPNNKIIQKETPKTPSVTRDEFIKQAEAKRQSLFDYKFIEDTTEDSSKHKELLQKSILTPFDVRPADERPAPGAFTSLLRYINETFVHSKPSSSSLSQTIAATLTAAIVAPPVIMYNVPPQLPVPGPVRGV